MKIFKKGNDALYNVSQQCGTYEHHTHIFLENVSTVFFGLKLTPLKNVKVFGLLV
jgi:hypothetical protein